MPFFFTRRFSQAVTLMVTLHRKAQALGQGRFVHSYSRSTHLSKKICSSASTSSEQPPKVSGKFYQKILMALLSRMQGFAKSSSKCGAETESGFAWTTNLRVS